MSYILDALKKHEQDREIGHVPTVDTHQEEQADRSGTSILLWVIVVLLLAIVALLSGYLWSQLERPAGVPTTAQQSVPPVQKPEAKAVTEPEQALKPVRTMPNRPVESRSPAIVEAQPSPALPDVTPPAPRVEPEPPPAVPAQAAQRIPLIDELSPLQRQGLPPLSLDVHVYAEQPARRFILLNLQTLREGDALDDIRVESITQAGVILSHQGLRFRLQRQ